MEKRRSKRKGMTIISEALLSLGIILVAVAFVFVGGNVISFQSGGLFSSAQSQMAGEVSSVIEGLPDASGSFSMTYEPGVESYTLTVQDNTVITVEVPGQETSSSSFVGLKLENTRISDSDALCIVKSGKQVNISSGSCRDSQLSSFCDNGRCVNNECQPELGETCGNSGGDCRCPSDATSDSASDVCMPDYKAGSYLSGEAAGDGQEDSTSMGCVPKQFHDKQSVSEKCSYDFECVDNTGSGTPVACNPSAPSGPSGSYCCPTGLSYAGPSEGCKFVNRFHLVFVPLQYENGEYSKFRNWVENEYLPMWLDDIPVSRSEIKVDILEPSEVDNSAIQSTGTGDCPVADINLAKSEANAHVNSNYDHAVGIYEDTSRCGRAYCGSYKPVSISEGSVSAAENPIKGWGEGVAAQEIAHNWGFNHIPPYECNSGNNACGNQRKYSCPTNRGSDYMQNSDGALNDYFPQAEDCIKELFKEKGWAGLNSFTKSDSSCRLHLIS